MRSVPVFWGKIRISRILGNFVKPRGSCWYFVLEGSWKVARRLHLKSFESIIEAIIIDIDFCALSYDKRGHELWQNDKIIGSFFSFQEFFLANLTPGKDNSK